jgi:hypothetical protein
MDFSKSVGIFSTKFIERKAPPMGQGFSLFYG